MAAPPGARRGGGRRNLHPDTFTLILGRRYNRAKKAAADLIGQVYNQRKMPNGVKKLTQNELADGSTYDAVAAELGVSRATVQRGGEYGRGQKVVAQMPQPMDAKPSPKAREEAAKSVGEIARAFRMRPGKA